MKVLCPEDTDFYPSDRLFFFGVICLLSSMIVLCHCLSLPCPQALALGHMWEGFCLSNEYVNSVLEDHCSSHISGAQQATGGHCVGQCSCGSFPSSQKVLSDSADQELFMCEEFRVITPAAKIRSNETP